MLPLIVRTSDIVRRISDQPMRALLHQIAALTTGAVGFGVVAMR
jgi:hypothetical protein